MYHYDQYERVMRVVKEDGEEYGEESEKEEVIEERCGDLASVDEYHSECLRRSIEKCLDGLMNYPTCIERSTIMNPMEK